MRAIRNSFILLFSDLKRICTNWVTLVVLGGLILLPSLYAWFNIYASWDPYSKTGGIHVGVVNNDKGTTLDKININIGEQVADNLKENTALGWTFYDTSDDALQDLYAGKLYATIVIPENFSEKIITILDAEPQKPELDYYVNEKLNAISPKITDKGATTIQNQITTSFVETVSDKAIEIMQGIGTDVKEQLPDIDKLKNMIINIRNHFPSIYDRLDKLAETAKDGKVFIDRQDGNVNDLIALLDKVSGFNSDVQDTLNKLYEKPDERIPKIRDNLLTLRQISNDMMELNKDLRDGLIENKPDIIARLDALMLDVDSIKNSLDEISDRAIELDNKVATKIRNIKSDIVNKLNDYNASLTTLREKLANNENITGALTDLEAKASALREKIAEFNNAISDAGSNIDSSLKKLQRIIKLLEITSQIPNIPSKPILPTSPNNQVPPENSSTSDNPTTPDNSVTPNNEVTPPVETPSVDITSPNDSSSDSGTVDNSDASATDSISTEDINYYNGANNISPTEQEVIPTWNDTNSIQNIISSLSGIKSDFSEIEYSDVQGGIDDLTSELTSFNKKLKNGTATNDDVMRIEMKKQSLSTIISNVRNRINNGVDSITSKLDRVEDKIINVERAISSINSLVSSGSDKAQDKINQLLETIDTMQSEITIITNDLIDNNHSMADRISTKVVTINKRLNDLKTDISKLKDKINETDVAEKMLDNFYNLFRDVTVNLDSAIDLLDDDLVSKLKQQISSTSTFIELLNKVTINTNNELVQLKKFGEKLKNSSDVLVSDIETLKENLPVIQKYVGKVTDALEQLSGEVSIGDIIDTLLSDGSAKSNFLAEPVNLKDYKLFPIANYGAGLTPFYTTLCLWVGALLLCALLSTKVHHSDLEIKPVEEYLSKYYLFVLMAMMQGFIAAAGDIVILHVEIKEKLLFVILAVFYSIVFTTIVYTFVALFGNVGKAIGVILLVLQLGGAGGTFPIETTPEFFQRIHQFLPFTYGISGMREAVAGVYYPTIRQDIIVLVVFGLVFIIIGIVFKKVANKFLEKFSVKLAKSGVIGH